LLAAHGKIQQLTQAIRRRLSGWRHSSAKLHLWLAP
jgi:hypothetical protein